MPGKSLPRSGFAAEDVLATLEALRDDDVRWHDGRVWSLVFHAGDELSRFTKRAYTTFFSENGLNPSAFPSLKRLENEVVAMTAALLGGGDEVAGSMTSGGTESILMAVKTAREWARARHPRITQPEMILPTSAHPAFEKAAHYFGVRPIHVGVGKDFRADIKATRRAISRRTILLVGSAPQYPQGVVDPIEALAELAAKRGILCHVDACVGGFMLPFVRDMGYAVPPFDFGVQGVTSMSVDLHKYGYAAKGASVVLYRDASLRKHQYFAYTDWPGGIYVSPSMTGTRPGGAIAAAWAVMHRLGHDGYLEIARSVMITARRLRRRVDSIEDLQILGEPHMSVMCIGSDTLDIYEVGDQMQARGWHLDRQQSPPSLHLTINHAHIQSADQFIEDLRDAVSHSQRDDRDKWIARSKQIAIRTALRLMPGRLASKVTSVASEHLGVGTGDVPKRSAAMYGMMAALPNRGDLETIVVDILDKMTRFVPADEIEMRTGVATTGKQEPTPDP